MEFVGLYKCVEEGVGAMTTNKCDEEHAGDEATPAAADDKATLDNNSDDEWQDILGSGCILKKCLASGSGSKPVRGDRCEIRVAGRLRDGGKPVDNHHLLTVTIGEHDIIPGIDLTLCLMEVGEICQLKITDRFAYGSKGRSPDVPPNASIDYEVELVSVLGPLDVTKLSVDEKLTMGDGKREKGNNLYSRDAYSDAITMYTKAIDILDDHHNISGASEDTLQEILELRLKCYNNLAAAQLKVEAYDAALKSCDTVLKCQPRNVKALFRKGKVLGNKGELHSAIKILKDALSIEPETKIIHQELSKLVTKQKKEDEKEKAMYRRMFGTDKDTAATEKSPSSSFNKWGLLAVVGAAVTVAAGLIISKYL